MRNLAILLVISLLAVGLCAAEIEGQWNGVLDAMGMQLTLVVHVNKSDTGLAVTLDSPDQGAFDIPADDASFSDGTLEFSVGSIMASYKGTLKDGVIDGVFKQAVFEAPLLLSREKVEKKPLPKKIQEPEEPYPYLQEEVSFVNEKAGITLRGTLTIPEGKGPFPAVILVSGSGPQDRNEERFGHKPFGMPIPRTACPNATASPCTATACPAPSVIRFNPAISAHLRVTAADTKSPETVKSMDRSKIHCPAQ